MYFFYIVRCSDDSLYCGQTNDLSRRIGEHNSSDTKSAKYTKARRPVTLVYFETHQTIQSAMKREWQVKRWSKVKKEALICHNLIELQ
jgi:putative endonuclease